MTSSAGRAARFPTSSWTGRSGAAFRPWRPAATTSTSPQHRSPRESGSPGPLARKWDAPGNLARSLERRLPPHWVSRLGSFAGDGSDRGARRGNGRRPASPRRCVRATNFLAPLPAIGPCRPGARECWRAPALPERRGALPAPAVLPARPPGAAGVPPAAAARSCSSSLVDATRGRCAAGWRGRRADRAQARRRFRGQPCPVAVAAIAATSPGSLPRQTTCRSGRSSSRSNP